MLFVGWEVCVVKNYDRGLENATQGRRLSAPMSIPTFSYGGLPPPPPPPNFQLPTLEWEWIFAGSIYTLIPDVSTTVYDTQ